jgi:hypothetical protein
MRDFSAFTCPFAEPPIILGRNSSGFYIPTPTAIRNYLPYPDASVLKEMTLPYPFRVKEPVSQRLERLDSDSSFMNIVKSRHHSRSRRKKGSNDSEYIQQPNIKKRHSLDLGQVDQLLKQDVLLNHRNLKPKRSASVISDRTVEEIMSWVPDKNTVWQDEWKEEKTLSPPASNKKDPNRIPPPLWRLEVNQNSPDKQLHPLDILKK